MFTCRDRNNMNKIYGNSCQTKSQHKVGDGHEVQLQAEKLLAFDNCWEKKGQSSLMVYSVESQPHSRKGSIVKSRQYTQSIGDMSFSMGIDRYDIDR